MQYQKEKIDKRILNKKVIREKDNIWAENGEKKRIEPYEKNV